MKDRWGRLSKALKIIVIVWALATLGWIAVIIGNVVTNGWGIIGIRDIWPMALSSVVMIVCIWLNTKPREE